MIQFVVVIFLAVLYICVAAIVYAILLLLLGRVTVFPTYKDHTDVSRR